MVDSYTREGFLRGSAGRGGEESGRSSEVRLGGPSTGAAFYWPLSPDAIYGKEWLVRQARPALRRVGVWWT
jgi:hypothetical protein